MSEHLQALRTALELSPDNEILRAHVVKEFLKAKQWQGAQELATPLRVGNFRPLALLTEAWTSLADGNLEAARSHYTKAISSDRSLIDEQLEAGLQEEPPLTVPALPASAATEVKADNFLRITFEQIGGMDPVKEKIRLNILYPLEKPEIYAAYGKKIGGGLLLYGPPGCGKTHLARATAGEIGANFFILSLNEILSMWLGESEKQLAQLFKAAREAAPSVIFIDEVDALGAKRSDFNNAASRNIVSQFLVEMDGMVSSNHKVMVLGATNMPWNVDSALRRPGRFDKVIFVPPPDRKAREQILSIHCQGRKTESGLRTAEVAAKTEHFSGADLAHLVDLASERALAEALKSGNLRDISARDFELALRECKPSTLEWLRRAKNYVNFANQDGLYDDLQDYLDRAKIR